MWDRSRCDPRPRPVSSQGSTCNRWKRSARRRGAAAGWRAPFPPAGVLGKTGAAQVRRTHVAVRQGQRVCRCHTRHKTVPGGGTGPGPCQPLGGMHTGMDTPDGSGTKPSGVQAPVPQGVTHRKPTGRAGHGASPLRCGDPGSAKLQSVPWILFVDEPECFAGACPCLEPGS